MIFEPSPRQALAVFSIVFGIDRSQRSPDMHALGLNPRERAQLVRNGLLELDDVKPRGQRASLTESGWVWAQKHLDARLEAKSPAARTLSGVLKCLSAFLPRHGHVLTDFVARDAEIATQAAAKGKSAKRKSRKAPKKRAKALPAKRAKRTKTAAKAKAAKKAPKAKAAKKAKSSFVRTVAASKAFIDSSTDAHYTTSNTNGSSDESLGTRIRDAALAIAGAPRRRVRLRDLRSHLADVPREHLDRELFELVETGELVLYRIDDPTDIESEDERAAIRVAGFPRHILYLEH